MYLCTRRVAAGWTQEAPTLWDIIFVAALRTGICIACHDWKDLYVVSAVT
jgi:hypothetical protein